MEKYTFIIDYTISCGGISLDKEETFTVEHNNPLTAWQPAHTHCCDLWNAARQNRCTISNLVVRDEDGKVVFNWK